jgi:hypothetical protein
LNASAPEEAHCRSLVAPLLHQHVEFGTMLVDRSPSQIWLAAQRHEHVVQMPCTARLAPRRFGATGESSAELVYMNGPFVPPPPHQPDRAVHHIRATRTWLERNDSDMTARRAARPG